MNQVEIAGGVKRHDQPDTTRPSPRSVENILPLSEQQRAFWLYCQNDMNQDPGVLQARLHISGNIDLYLLQSAWQATVSEFEALRTSVNPNADGELFLICRNKCAAEVDVLDWQVIPIKDHPVELEHFLLQDKNRGLDLAIAPSSRLSLIWFSGNEALLVWTCHHLLLDGWSALVVINAFLNSYKRLQNGHAGKSREKLSYSQYRHRIKNISNTESLKYWQQTLRGYSKPALLGKPIVGKHRSGRSMQVHESLNAVEVQRFNTLCREAGVTAAAALQTVWASVLGCVCKSDDVVYGIATSGRPAQIDGIEAVVGYLATIVPVRYRLDNGLTNKQWMQESQQHSFSVQQHDTVSLAKILNYVDNNCGNNVFDSLLIFEKLPEISVPEALPFHILDYQSDVVSGYPITLTIVPGRPWKIRCDFNSEQFSEAWVHKLVTAFTMAIKLLSDNPDNTVSHYISHLRPLVPAQPTWHPDTQRISTETVESFCATDSIPTSMTQLDLLNIWEEVLHVKPLTMSSNFFEMGGSSFAALKLIMAIESHFGKRVPLARLLEHPTPEGMAQIVCAGEPDESGLPCIIPLVAEGHEPALFCLHAGGGYALLYKKFATLVGGKRPVYGVQPRGIDGYDSPLESIDAMAEFYVDEIVKYQPEGPYHLLAYCFSGALLVEMVRLMQKRGLPVGHLIIADAPAPITDNHPMANRSWKEYLFYEAVVNRNWRYLAHTFKRFLTNSVRAHRRRTSPGSSQISKKHIPDRLQRVQTACETAFKMHRAHPIDVHLNLLLSDHNSRISHILYARNWDKISPDLKKHAVASSHSGLFIEPYVETTSQIIENLLDQPSPNATRLMR